jgi:hypothetical protein
MNTNQHETSPATMTDAPVTWEAALIAWWERPAQQITWTLGGRPSQQSGQGDTLTGLAEEFQAYGKALRAHGDSLLQIARNNEAELHAREQTDALRDKRNADDVRRLVCGVYLGKL